MENEEPSEEPTASEDVQAEDCESRDMQASPIDNDEGNSMDVSTSSKNVDIADDESQSQSSEVTHSKLRKRSTDAEKDFRKESNLAFGVALRKSARAVTKTKETRQFATKGKSRRVIFKKSVSCSPIANSLD